MSYLVFVLSLSCLAFFRRRIVLSKTSPNKTKQGKTRQDKTRQYKTRQDKTRRDKKRQDNMMKKAQLFFSTFLTVALNQTSHPNA
jgi:hypothetical protein